MKDMTQEVPELRVLYRRSLVFSIIFDDQLYRMLFSDQAVE